MEKTPYYHSTEEADCRRREFYQTILRQPQVTPENDFRRLADAWRKVTGAAWVWLWLKNPFLVDSPWELREVSAGDASRSDYVPPQLLAPHPRPVAEYSTRLGKPVYVSDPKSWRGEIGNDEYTVACWPTLEGMGCESFLTVPFQSQPIPATVRKQGPLHGPLQGVVCSHYKSGRDYVQHPDESLVLMAQLTFLTVINSFQRFQQGILLELNALAEHYLSFISRNSTNDRKDYVSALIELLKRYLSVAAVSLFYQEDEFTDELSCLATTGLADSKYDPIPSSKLSSVTYRPGEGLTGRVFQSGEPLVLSRQEAARHSPRTVEIVDGKVIGRSDAVIFAIPRLKRRAPGERQSSTGARGVIRCCGHHSHLFRDQSRPFDPVDMETLDFISRQIAPILETLTVRIRREETISTIKHDLYNPLAMIRDTAEDIEKGIVDSQNWIRVKTFDIMNIGASALFASHLAQQLDPQPADDKKPDYQRTLLEKSIVARNKNMLSHYANRENEMSIYFDGFREIPVLWVDRDLIERALVNLLTNAIKYGAPRTRITVLASSQPDGFHIDVSNEGEGIGQEDEEKVFHRGFRSRAPHVANKFGLGLGLHIAKGAIEVHGGRLLLTCPRHPTTFTIILPENLKRGPLNV